jgi:hypothetical protein
MSTRLRAGTGLTSGAPPFLVFSRRVVGHAER